MSVFIPQIYVSTYYVSGMILGIEKTAVNKTKFPLSWN